ncbi:hypothetical protein L1987_58698 [Smallanthus sonchifolius]|uniref:Uncharacterized protein n=1 Tax=Smallanthus sonchifolius TaxID=185202 RepID=A0ACB9D391_9ASTR|nr:hypothetical protein L1987_58698 [Smallanthus sonchifolius]
MQRNIISFTEALSNLQLSKMKTLTLLSDLSLLPLDFQLGLYLCRLCYGAGQINSFAENGLIDNVVVPDGKFLTPARGSSWPMQAPLIVSSASPRVVPPLEIEYQAKSANCRNRSVYPHVRILRKYDSNGLEESGFFLCYQPLPPKSERIVSPYPSLDTIIGSIRNVSKQSEALNASGAQNPVNRSNIFTLEEQTYFYGVSRSGNINPFTHEWVDCLIEFVGSLAVSAANITCASFDL